MVFQALVAPILAKRLGCTVELLTELLMEFPGRVQNQLLLTSTCYVVFQKNQFDIGVAYDGDGDRSISVTKKVHSLGR